MIHKRRHYIRKIFRKFNLDFENHELNPAIKYIKEQNKKDLIGVEIGVLCGWNALDMLKNLDIKRLYLIDPYKFYKGFEDYDSQEDITWCKNFAHNLLKEYGDKIVWIEDFSLISSLSFKDESLDFVYIDGNHSYKYSREDILSYLPKVKNGGILSGDDYSLTPNFIKMGHGVAKALHETIKYPNFFFHKTDWWYIK